MNTDATKGNRSIMPNLKKRCKKYLKKALRKSAVIIQKLKPVHYVAIVLVIGLAIFNSVTGISPYVKQYNRERNIEKTFEQWWKDAGEAQFRSVGLEPTKELKTEEFQSYREKYLLQNPSFIVKDRVKNMAKDFRDWWEVKGGKESFMQENGRYPTEADFRRSLEQWILKYTDQFVRYNMAFVPRHGHYERLATSWILFPSVPSFIIFAPLFLLAIVQLRRRWTVPVLAGFVVLFAMGGGVIVDVLTSTSFFDHYAGERYMGMSIALAFLLGAVSFAPRKNSVSQVITGISVAGLLLDMIINWFFNPGIFGAVAVAEPLCFGLGALAGIKIETRRKTRDEINAALLEERLRANANSNPMAERKAKTRALIDEGFKAAKEALNEKAQSVLSMALTSLLQEHPIDTPLVKSLAERMTSPSLYIEVPSTQWLEWGQIAKTKNAPEAAILLLKKGLSIEKDANLARRALFILGEICVNNNIERENGFRHLEKVVAMNPNDILSKQAARLLEKKEEK